MRKCDESSSDKQNKKTERPSAKKNKVTGVLTADKQLKIYADNCAKTITDLIYANTELQDAYHDTLHRLILAAEYKDEDTADHTTRIGRYSALIAEKIGLPHQTVQNILHAAPLHDVGKIGVPDSILLKPGKLSAREFEIIKTHTTIGADILSDAKAEILQVAQVIAVSHHENWNGTGYPQGLSGENIPLIGRIVKLVDVFDAITSRRPYKEPYPIETALDMIIREREKLFDPELADIFIASINDIAEIKEEVGSPEDISVLDYF